MLKLNYEGLWDAESKPETYVCLKIDREQHGILYSITLCWTTVSEPKLYCTASLLSINPCVKSYRHLSNTFPILHTFSPPKILFFNLFALLVGVEVHPLSTNLITTNRNTISNKLLWHTYLWASHWVQFIFKHMTYIMI